MKWSSTYMHCGCDFSIKTLQHAWKETREHTCCFLTTVSTFLCDQQKPKCRFFTQDTGANHTPKKNLYIGLTAVATAHMGKGIAHMTCSDVFFQIRTREQESGNGTGFPPGTSVSPVSIFPSTFHTHLYLHVCLSEGQTWEHSDKANISGYHRG